MQGDIEKVLITRQAIAQRIAELARDITRDLQKVESDRAPQITLIPILTGSLIFVADLIRELPLRLQVKLMSISSYPGAATSSRGAQVEAALTRIPASLVGQHILLVDDILDTGHTLRTAQALLAQRRPQSLRTCVLLRKNRPETRDVPVDYVAFEVPDEFVAGYGLDYDDYYRNLPEIVTLKSHVLKPDNDMGRNGA